MKKRINPGALGEDRLWKWNGRGALERTVRRGRIECRLTISALYPAPKTQHEFEVNRLPWSGAECYLLAPPGAPWPVEKTLGGRSAVVPRERAKAYAAGVAREGASCHAEEPVTSWTRTVLRCGG